MLSIQVHVYEDGNTKLTRLDLDKGIYRELNDLYFNPVEIQEGKLHKELEDYGFKPADIKSAVDFIMKACVNESCIVGKV